MEIGGPRPARRDPCAECGQATAVGTPRFSDRRVVEREDGTRGFLCAECVAVMVAARRGKPLTDAEVRRQVDNGAAAMAWAGGTPGHGVF